MAKVFKGTFGNDVLSCTTSGALVNGLVGNDIIANYGSNVTIDGGEGNFLNDL